MEILIYISLVVLLGLGALFVIPRSNCKGVHITCNLSLNPLPLSIVILQVKEMQRI